MSRNDTSCKQPYSVSSSTHHKYKNKENSASASLNNTLVLSPPSLKKKETNPDPGSISYLKSQQATTFTAAQQKSEDRVPHHSIPNGQKL